jgi:hypothetical protein
MSKCFIMFMTYVFVLAITLAVVMSGIGFGYFNDPWIISNPSINTKVLFGCGIGLTIGLWLGSWLFIFDTKNACTYLCTFPLYLMIFGLYIAYITPAAVNRHMESWESHWEPSLTAIQELQRERQCCGWNNASDRGLDICPDHFDSGCAGLAKEYFEPRLEDLFISFVLILSILVVSIVLLLVCTCCVEDEDDIAQCFDL